MIMPSRMGASADAYAAALDLAAAGVLDDPGAGEWRWEYLIAVDNRVVEVLALAAGETVDDLLTMALGAGERIACRLVWDGPIQELAARVAGEHGPELAPLPPGHRITPTGITQP